jgi:hypothetical protein
MPALETVVWMRCSGSKFRTHAIEDAFSEFLFLAALLAGAVGQVVAAEETLAVRAARRVRLPSILLRARDLGILLTFRNVW